MNGQIVLGVTGSIAAYKSAEIVRLLTKAGLDVRVIMTDAATQFLAPLTLETLTGHPVTTKMFENPDSGGLEYGDLGAGTNSDGAGARAASSVEHIRASRAADLIVVAPATANLLGKVAHGIADDSLTTSILASSIPVLFAPAMNTRMWENPAVVENVKILRRRGYRFVDPGSGDLACGEIGAGRMADPAEVADAVLRLLHENKQAPGLLVTAGGTEESIDPVRCLTNHSSGRMGIAIAAAGRDLGLRVTLVAARISTELPYGVDVVRVGSAREMAKAVQSQHAAHDLLVMCAAVADYRPKTRARTKLSGREAGKSILLVENLDILESLAGKRNGQVTVGFALQTGGTKKSRIDSARAKLEAKQLDLIVLNDPTKDGSEFGGSSNEATLIDSGSSVEDLPLLSKDDLARTLLARTLEIARAKGTLS